MSVPSGNNPFSFAGSLIIRWIFIPLRFIFIFFRGGSFLIGWLFRGNSSKNLGDFYQGLFEALGGTFIKAGQAMAMRQDLIPIEHCEALSRLMETVPHFSLEKAKQTIEKDLETSIKELFDIFYETPVAAASFSQVHKATLRSGETVAVKVKRPWIEEIVFADTRLIYFFASILHFLGAGKQFRILDIAREINLVLWDELDYAREGRFLKIFKLHQEAISFLKVPDFFPTHSGNRVITMSFLEGISLREAMTRKRQNPEEEIKFPSGETVDLKKAARRIYEITMRSVFELGCFHADLHHGNILLMEGQKIGLIDFGIVGLLTKELKEKNFDYIEALCSGNIEEAAEIFTTIVSPGPGADKASLKREMIIELQYWRACSGDPNASFHDKSSATVLNNSVDYARRFHFLPPRNTVLYYKTILNIDHINLELNPEYDSLQEGLEFIQGYQERILSKESGWENISRKITQSLKSLSALPQAFADLEKIIHELKDRKKSQASYNIYIRLFNVTGKGLILTGILIPLFKFWISPATLDFISDWGCIVLGIGLVIGGMQFLKGSYSLEKDISES